MVSKMSTLRNAYGIFANVVISQVYETGTVKEVPEDRCVEEVELKCCTGDNVGVSCRQNWHSIYVFVWLQNTGFLERAICSKCDSSSSRLSDRNRGRRVNSQYLVLVRDFTPTACNSFTAAQKKTTAQSLQFRCSL